MSSHPSQSLPSSPPLPPPLHSVESQAIDMITHESPVPDHVTSDHIKETLYERVIDEDWEAVLKIYQEHKPIVQKAKLLRSEETALHMAISMSKIDVAKKLLKIIDQDVIQELTDGRGDNPLHLAATLGQVEMCKLLLEKDRRLISNRNNEGETPLFLAVLQGQKGAFYALHPICTLTGVNTVYDIRLCRKYDGNTILHVSILGEDFELAYQIVHWYPELIPTRNERGQLALHFLANNPSAFKSGSFLGMVDEFIYGCLNVDPVPSRLDDKHYSVPGNYETCLDALKLCKKIINIIGFRAREWKTCIMCDKNVEQHQLPTQSTVETREEEKDDYSTPRLPYPPNYYVLFRFLRLLMQPLLFFLGIVYFQVGNLKEQKRRHKLTCQVMEKLLSNVRRWEYRDTRSRIIPQVNRRDNPSLHLQDQVEYMHEDQPLEVDRTDLEESSLILIAAKFGVVEMVQRLLHDFPMAIHEHDADNKNVALLAAENRHQKICELLLGNSHYKRIFQQAVDKNGNTAIHLAANLGERWRWRISGAAILLQWELKWYNLIKSSVAPNLLGHRNNAGKSSKEVFDETHEDLVKDAVKWLNNVSQSCSVVATIIATMAYTSATTVPGGTDGTTGIPILRGRPAFGIFTISSLIALCFSLGSLSLFLSILTSHYNAIDFLRSVPRKVILGFTSLFISIAAMLVSFCAGHFFNLEEHMRHTAFPIYIITFSLGSIYVLTQFPLYFFLIKSTF